MDSQFNIAHRQTQTWTLEDIVITHSVIDFKSMDKQVAKNESDYVRMHFGLLGSYDFTLKQLDRSFSLSGHHNNIMYSKGLDLEVHNRSKRVETFGVNFDKDFFIEIGQSGNEILKRFTDEVLNGRNCILAPNWKSSNLMMQGVIQEILNCSFQDDLKKLFLLSKSIELLVLQAEQYSSNDARPYIRSLEDKRKLVEAKEYLSTKIDSPPTIVELSKLIGINEYKLKRGFKEMFGTTIFGYIHFLRMGMAKRLLLGTDKTAKEIAFITGYSSPQHFSNAFKKKFGVTPKSVRINPENVIDAHSE